MYYSKFRELAKSGQQLVKGQKRLAVALQDLCGVSKAMAKAKHNVIVINNTSSIAPHGGSWTAVAAAVSASPVTGSKVYLIFMSFAAICQLRKGFSIALCGTSMTLRTSHMQKVRSY